MSFMSSTNYDTKNHHHHHLHHQPYHHTNHPNNKEASYESFVDPLRRNNRVQEYERSKVCVRVGDQEICKESVDAVTEEFLKLEHQKFGYNKWTNAG
ncbi:hypothetical protein JCGZ_17850 [Jatropha curcas]|uniref:Uncharacterized protein n=1 Tax=Jatropha curcas TaxID=180498 RepID=A0A067JS28_JATCU|nr:hypothetical protein JCGZ_17850 [Jatropha curcas]